MSAATVLLILVGLVLLGVAEVQGQGWLESHVQAKHAND